MNFRSYFVSLCLIFFSGCSGGSSLTDPPEWLLHLPTENGRLYAVGVSGPTYFVEDAIKNACDDARKEIAKSLQSEIYSFYFGIDATRSPSAKEYSSVQVTSSTTDVSLNNSQILAVWVDREGTAPGGMPKYVYALACLNLQDSRVRDLFNERK